MKKLKQATAFLLALLLLASAALLAGCGKEDGSETVTSGEAVTEAPDTRVRIIDGGVAKYTVIYPNSAPAAIMQAMNRFVDNIYKQTGVRLDTKSDMLRVGKEHDPEKPEILFGVTNYDETAAALDGLASDQYTIRQVGKKLVIAAHNDSYMVAAGNYFTSNLLKKNLVKDAEGKATLYFEEYTHPSASIGSKLSINGRFIHEFCIVYPADAAGYKTVAEQLQAAVKATAGVVLNIYSDAERKEAGCEFLIGKTNRTLSSTLYGEKKPALLSGELVVKGDQVQVLAGGPYSAKECVSKMQFSFLAEAKDYRDGSHLTLSLAADAPNKTEGSDLRLMTVNVLAGRWGEDTTAGVPAVAERVEILAAVLEKYRPDAVGLQETDDRWVELLPGYLQILKEDYGIEYTWMFSAMSDNKPNLTSILYRSDLYTLQASECHDNSYWPSNMPYHMRALAWVKLASVQVPAQQFILLNTHWAQALEDPSWLTKSVQEQIELVNSLKTTHNVPIFCTGDYNSKSDSDEVAKLLSDTGMRETMLQAAEAGTRVNNIGGCGGVGNPRTSDTYIDHIFGHGNYGVLRYETVLGNRVIWLSDHAPQYADIKLN